MITLYFSTYVHLSISLHKIQETLNLTIKRKIRNNLLVWSMQSLLGEIFITSQLLKFRSLLLLVKKKRGTLLWKNRSFHLKVYSSNTYVCSMDFNWLAQIVNNISAAQLIHLVKQWKCLNENYIHLLLWKCCFIFTSKDLVTNSI